MKSFKEKNKTIRLFLFFLYVYTRRIYTSRYKKKLLSMYINKNILLNFLNNKYSI